jgi:membrane protein DedA with SNARE-associated domain
VLAFIDAVVIPFLEALYGALGYLGVFVAMTIESAMIPLPSELILPFAGFLVSDPTQIEPLTGQPWSFWLAVIAATIGNTTGSLIAYAIGAYGGRPFFQRWGVPTVFFSRMLPIVRTFISFPAGVARMPLGTFVLFSTLGAIPWSIALVYAGTVLGANWVEIRELLQPFDLLIAVSVVAAVALFIWWRLGMPGLRGHRLLSRSEVLEDEE